MDGFPFADGEGMDYLEKKIAPDTKTRITLQANGYESNGIDTLKTYYFGGSYIETLINHIHTCCWALLPVIKTSP